MHFRQPLKYPCFTLSLREDENTMQKFSNPHREKHTGNEKACSYTRTKLNKCRSFSVHDGVECEGCVKRKAVSKVLRKYNVWV